MTKQDEYRELVQKRKECARCQDLVNPAQCCKGDYDGEEIGPWSLWQGYLDARLLVVGQDWGDERCFRGDRGRDTASNPTNRTIVELLEVAGVQINPVGSECPHKGRVFLTNAILCLKSGGLQAPVKKPWFENCGKEFLLPLIRIVRPEVVVTLGVRAFEAIVSAVGGKPATGSFREIVEDPNGFEIDAGIRLFPRYHCGRRILNTHRKIEQQREDWKKIGQFLKRGMAFNRC
jgi:uracil-DNA glycosylase